MMNRHGLIAGATGTGKTRTLQLLTEQLSAQGVPVFVGGHQGRPGGPRHAGRGHRPGHRPRQGRRVGLEAGGVPVEFVSLTGQARRAAPRHGELVRAAAAGQGALAQRHPDQRPDDGLQVLRRRPAAAARLRRPARRAPVPRLRRGQAGAGAVRRDVAAQRWACCCARWSSWSRRAPASSSASRSSTSRTCSHVTSDGRGRGHLPRAGRRAGQAAALVDLHDVAAGASSITTCPRSATCPSRSSRSSSTRRTCSSPTRRKAFLDQVQQVVRLIRSKGVGVYFVTQTPKDVPNDVLAQLSNRVQHALRAHTPDDDTALRATRPHLSQDAILRSRGDAHLARHRRGGRDRARRPRHADAGRGDPAHSARLAHGAAHARGAAGGHPPVGPARRIRPGGGSRERAGDAGRAHGATQATAPAAPAPASEPPTPPARAERAAKTVAQVAGGALVGALVVHDRPDGRPRDHPRPLRPARRQAAAPPPPGGRGGSHPSPGGRAGPDHPRARRFHRRGAARRLSRS